MFKKLLFLSSCIASTTTAMDQNTYKNEFDAFFSPARLWLTTDLEKFSTTTPAPKEAVKYLEELPHNEAAEYNKINEWDPCVLVLKYGNEKIFATKNNVSIYKNNGAKLSLELSFYLPMSDQETGPDQEPEIVSLYKDINHTNNNLITIGLSDGSIIFVDQNLRKAFKIDKAFKFKPTYITTWDNNTKWIVIGDKDFCLFGFSPLLDLSKDETKKRTDSNLYHYRSKCPTNYPIKRAGFNKATLIVEQTNGELLQINPYPAKDMDTLEHCTFLPQQASLVYRLIQCHNNKKKPFITEAEKAVFDSLSETFKNILMNTKTGPFSYEPLD